MDCIFCKIISGDIPSYKIYEDDKILAFLDVNPVNPGHTLIIPKEHTLDVTTIDNDTLIKILDKSRDIANILINKMNANGFTLVQNNGIAQEVKHFHLHVIPKYNKDIKMKIEDVHMTMTK
jgi:histidine triad (HIT) family protein